MVILWPAGWGLIDISDVHCQHVLITYVQVVIDSEPQAELSATRLIVKARVRLEAYCAI